MQEDFHYYATYCAAFIAGYSHEESLQICYGAQLVDLCSKTFLTKLKAPLSAATTQLQLEMMDARLDVVGLQDITRIWASFHFLPYDLYAKKPKRSKSYMHRYRLICGPDSELVKETVGLAKSASLPAVGLAMHVLADTWAHRYFAGTPSLVINNTNYHFYETVEKDGETTERQIRFTHKPSSPDDVFEGVYTNTLYQPKERAIMNLGHGRAGHFPDYSFARYRYLPAWGDYEEIIKDNPSDYMNAFCQMIYAMKYIRGEREEFEKEHYEKENISQWSETIDGILRKRQINANEDWKEFAKTLSGQEIEDFVIEKYMDEYIHAEKDQKDDTYLGQFIIAALKQKSMVTGKIYRSKNPLAGISVNYNGKGIKGIRDYAKLISAVQEEKHESD